MDAVTTRHLSKRYDNDILAVDDLDLEIHRGEVFGLLGPNGAGKTTIIGMLTGLIKPTSGTITILDQSMSGAADKLVPRIGFIPQELVFYQHLTVQENLALFASCHEIPTPQDNINEVTQLLQISNLSNRQAATLSGGQKRRLNLAIGLLHSPELLLLDEPSAGMDPQSRNALWQSIENVAGTGITIILCTHLMETADRLSDRIAIIDHGEVVTLGTPAELKATYGTGDSIRFTFTDMNKIDTKTLTDKLTTEFNATTEIDNQTFRVDVKDGLSQVSAIIKSVETTVDEQVIQQITVQENTLEDVFLGITGKELR